MIEPPGGRRLTRTVIIITLMMKRSRMSKFAMKQRQHNRYLDERTPTPGDTFGVADQLFSTLRRKPR